MKSSTYFAALLVLSLIVTISGVLAVCNMPPPAVPKGAPDDSARTPADEDPPAEDPPSPPPPTAEPTPEPIGAPSTPPPEPPRPPRQPNPGGPVGSIPGSGGAASPRPRPGVSYAGAWHIWWELNREHLLGLRKTIAMTEPTSGRSVDPMIEIRPKVRQVLRAVSLRTKDRSVQATALRALGRTGNDEDARLFLEILRRRDIPEDVQVAAAIGLGSLEKIESDDLRKEIRKFAGELLTGKLRLPHDAYMISIIAVSLRARTDPALVRHIAAKCARKPSSANEAAALLFSCGLTRDALLGQEVMAAAKSGELGTRTLHDVARAHAVVAVALTGAEGVTGGLLEILTHKKTRVHTRRGVAVALGKLLREGRMTDEEQELTRRTVMKVFDKDRDPLVQGYTAIAMGSAKPPIGIEILMKTVDRTGSADVKPFAAIALGLAVANLDERDAKRVRSFLVTELAKTRDIQLSGALSISVGLAGATAARDLLIRRATDQRLNASIRGPACQALGLLRDMSPRVKKALLAGLEDGSYEVVEDSCIALGFIGGSGTARLLCDKLVKTRSAVVQAHMVVALSHLGGTAAIEPLLAIVANPDMNPTMRESAAAALGILCDPRETDPMFEIDASVNPYGLTSATRELVRIY